MCTFEVRELSDPFGQDLNKGFKRFDPENSIENIEGQQICVSSRSRVTVISLTELWGRTPWSDQNFLMYLFKFFLIVAVVRGIWCFAGSAIRNDPDVIRRSRSLYLVTSLDIQ
jgi:hypothetical protein